MKIAYSRWFGLYGKIKEWDVHMVKQKNEIKFIFVHYTTIKILLQDLVEVRMPLPVQAHTTVTEDPQTP